ncbi:SDR family oxidoreductase [Aurantiacibacter rhizosphaerae]|uniref:NAD-dependent epimerase/dehydratase family protein n=1 Tax=Aurantiacibacter rhizosphaerae TaxID=2691582 RepID=A0A844XAJ5_9SPHN|nr:SDR family oxidoreductase [Aurantiacibacter rhizosphaerae]MWV26658.1 NAD-dependent epimerase/dehydratase family protein [Aurantiacibacter rhizosphaerae]
MQKEFWFDRPGQTELRDRLRANRRHWLVTGAAGFIGSNLVESLLQLGQTVTGLDNFATGHAYNLKHVESCVGDDFANFTLIEGDIRDFDTCAAAVKDVDVVLHQAALGSVPRSIEDPRTSHDVNVTGFLNMLDASRLGGVQSFVYAASSSTYGDEPQLPKIEDRIGNPLSPYAATKLFDEIYADIYRRTYDFSSVGLRYFNVFGPRQDPQGAYAAVIPKWTDLMIDGQSITINGDGETSRDFCFVDNAVQANLRAGLAQLRGENEVVNVAVGQRTTLNELFTRIREELANYQIGYDKDPIHADFRKGDVRHSLASIDKGRDLLGYDPTHTIVTGLEAAMPWYVEERRRVIADFNS